MTRPPRLAAGAALVAAGLTLAASCTAAATEMQSLGPNH